MGENPVQDLAPGIEEEVLYITGLILRVEVGVCIS